MYSLNFPFIIPYLCEPKFCVLQLEAERALTMSVTQSVNASEGESTRAGDGGAKRRIPIPVPKHFCPSSS